MRNTPLGCLSGSGLLATLVTLLAISGVALAQGEQLFSPGPLNAQMDGRSLGGVRSHAETGRHCSACHAAPWSLQKMADRCLNCHQYLLDESTDFHAIMIAESKNTACQECHTDHHGPNAPMAVTDLENFPHDLLGYSLRGHQRMADSSIFACSDCHGEKIASFDQSTCTSCHVDLETAFIQAHMEAFGQNCLACHDGVDSYGADFDHNSTGFPLLAKHAEANCAGCHQGARTLNALQTAPQDCSGCHAGDDPHTGRFGSDCSLCHDEVDWRQATFDHSLANFPLEGGHLQVPCQDCHQENPFAGTPQECFACHAEPELHSGLFSNECSSCHSVQSWSPARFEQPHAFPLSHGISGQSECQVCHPQTLQAYTCYGCHEHTSAAIESKHRGEGIAKFQDCVKCHASGRKDETEGGEESGGD